MCFDYIPEEETKKTMLIQRVDYISMAIQQQVNDISNKLADERHIEKGDLKNFDKEKRSQLLSDITSLINKTLDIIEYVKEKCHSEDVDDNLEDCLKEACILLTNSEKLIENL